MKNETVCHDFYFPGTLAFPVAASPDGQPWRKKVTSTSGNGTVSAAGGFAKLLMSADNEAQNLCLYFGDDLSYDIDKLIAFEIWLKASAALGANSKLRFGMCSARNDNPDSIAESVFFGVDATAALHVESDDGANELAATSTGLSLGTSVKKFALDFRSGIVTGIPATGGKAQVLALAEDGTGGLARVLRNSRLNLSNYAAGLQPFVQLQKASSTDAVTVSVQRVRIEFELD